MTVLAASCDALRGAGLLLSLLRRHFDRLAGLLDGVPRHVAGSPGRQPDIDDRGRRRGAGRRR